MQTFCFRSTLRTAVLRPSLQTFCFRSTLRTIILRLSPTAAAEWAKPREIRRGNCKSAAFFRGRTAVLNNFNSLTPKLLFGETREASTRTSPPGSSGTRKSSTKITFHRTTINISQGPEGAVVVTPLPPREAFFVVNMCIFQPASQNCLFFSYETANSAAEAVFYRKYVIFSASLPFLLYFPD